MRKSNKLYDWNPTNLQKLIHASESTTTHIANQAGIRHKVLFEALQSKCCPTVSTLCKLADALHVPVDFLLCRCSEREANDFLKVWKSGYEGIRRERYETIIFKQHDSVKIPDGYDLPYPYNLWQAIFGKPSDHILRQAELDALQYILSLIDEKYHTVIQYYYRDNLSFSKIGTKMHYSEETIRKMFHKGIRYLRNPVMMNYLKLEKPIQKYYPTEDRSTQKIPQESIAVLCLPQPIENRLLTNRIKHTDTLVQSIRDGHLISCRGIAQKRYNEIIEAVNRRYGCHFRPIQEVYNRNLRIENI